MQALTATEVLDTLNAAGLVLSLTPDNRLKVTPASAMTPELRDVIRLYKLLLVDYLIQQTNEAERELFEERAAIMEYDGVMMRAQAERLALLHTTYLLHHWSCKTCCAAGQGRGDRCAIGADLWAAYGSQAVS